MKSHSTLKIVRLTVFLMLFGLLAYGPHASALSIVRNFTGGSAPGNAAGGGNLEDIFDAAADWWEMAILDPHTLTLNFGWAPLAPKADHTLIAEGGTPHRETEGRIRFDNDESFSWFLDATPHEDEEYQPGVVENTTDLGGGSINVERRHINPVAGSDAADRPDLLQTAKHEIGHALGMSGANDAYVAESADGDIDVTAGLPFAGSVIPVSGSHFTNALNDALMWGGGLPANERRVQDAVSILANAQISGFNSVNLDPKNQDSLRHIDFQTTSESLGLTPLNLAENLVGTNVSISNVTYTGAGNASGTFSRALGTGIGIDNGVILTSGSAANAFGPNVSESTSTVNGVPGSALLDPFVSFQTFDASVLSFDFIPTGDSVTFNYVFASDEYEEFSTSVFNDGFGFFVNGTNQAVIPGTTTPVTINNVNQFNNSGFYNSNSPAGLGPHNIEYDGFTDVFQLTAIVNSGVVNHIDLAISDTSDAIYDSAVFIEAGTFSSGVVNETPGATAANPLLPNLEGPGGIFNFNFTPFFGGFTFIDPHIAVGYDYILNSGPAFITSVVLPALPFDTMYDLFLWDGAGFNIFGGVLTAGLEHLFAGLGVDRFRILGIDIQNMLNPNDPLAFVTGLKFSSLDPVDLDMIAITDPIPEPSSFVLFSIGIIGLFGYGWRRRKNIVK